ncbi:MAG: hypothetical protein ABI433_01035 [Burkholderiaceae bacterium]
MSDSNKKVEYEITADGSGFVQTMEKVAAASTGAAATVKSQFNGVGEAFDKVQKQLLLITSIVAGGAFFKEAIGASNKLTGEVLTLSRRLGITAEEASTLNTALGDIYTDSDTYIGAFDKFAKQIKKNEQGLQDMGLQTRDANGDLRDSNQLFNEAVQEVGKYKPGLDQTTAAMSLFGKSVDDVMKLQKLNNTVLEEAKAKNLALGLTISRENVEATKKYKAAMNDVGDVLMAVQKAVGDAVMPVFTELAEYFASAGPYVVSVFKGALTGLLLVFRTVQVAIKSFSAFVFETINLIIDQVGNLSDLLAAVFRGDFKGASDSFKRMTQRPIEAVQNVVNASKTAFREAQESFSSDVSRVWDKGTSVGAPKGGTKRMGEMGGGGADKSQMSEWDAKLSEQKLAIAEAARADGTFREMSKAQEREYWQAILSTIDRNSSDGLSIRKKIAEEGLAIDKQAFEARIETLKTEREDLEKNYAGRITLATTAFNEIVGKYGQESKEAQKAYGEILAERRKLNEQQRVLDSMAAESRRNLQMSGIELERVQVQESMALGTMSKQDGLEKERQFEVQMFGIRMAALNERKALVDPEKDPIALAQINAQVEMLEGQHQLRLAQVRSQAVLENNRYQTQFFSGMQASLETLLNRMLTGTLKMKDIFRSLFVSIGQTLAQTAAKMAADWLIAQIKMRIASKQTTLAELNNSAVAAAGAAYNAIVGIPYVGPFLAPAAAAVAYAGVMAFGATASAEGGYDIPASVNPIVQTHAREMILPAKHADVIRNLADGDGMPGGNGQPPQYVLPRGMSARDFYVTTAGDMVNALNGARRNFAF